jgi:hypothetical protein
MAAVNKEREKQFLEMFRERVGIPTQCESVPQASLRRYAGKLPQTLLNYWSMDGWSAYQQGLWWLVNPEEFEGTVAEWLAGTPFETADRYHAVARTAFGALKLWGETSACRALVDCCGNYIVANADLLHTREDDPDLAMSILLSGLDKDAGDVEDDDGNSLFDVALEQHGMLKRSEMYGFEPACVLGGELTAANIRVVRLDVHLSMLRQFAAPRIPGF